MKKLCIQTEKLPFSAWLNAFTSNTVTLVWYFFLSHLCCYKIIFQVWLYKLCCYLTPEIGNLYWWTCVKIPICQVNMAQNSYSLTCVWPLLSQEAAIDVHTSCICTVFRLPHKGLFLLHWKQILDCSFGNFVITDCTVSCQWWQNLPNWSVVLSITEINLTSIEFRAWICNHIHLNKYGIKLHILVQALIAVQLNSCWS